MIPGAVHHDESAEARVVAGALSETGQCVSCLAESTRLTELAVRGVLATIMKSRVVDTIELCDTCKARRLVYRYRTAAARTTY